MFGSYRERTHMGRRWGCGPDLAGVEVPHAGGGACGFLSTAEPWKRPEGRVPKVTAEAALTTLEG